MQPTTPNIALADVIPFVDVIGASKHLILGPLGENTGFVAAASSMVSLSMLGQFVTMLCTWPIEVFIRRFWLFRK